MTKQLINGIIYPLNANDFLEGGNTYMDRPIVSLCEMAMNESIATTCCYKWNGVSITGSASVLHGGKLKKESSTRYFFLEGGEIPGVWLNKSIKIRPLTASFASGVTSVWHDEEKWYVMRDGKTIQVTDEYGKVISSNGMFTTGNILGNKNRYNRQTTYTIMHVGSTSAHYQWTSGNNWRPDHLAVQYSS